MGEQRPRQRVTLPGGQHEWGRVQQKIPTVIADAGQVALHAVAAQSSLGQHQSQMRGRTTHAQCHDIADSTAAPDVGMAFVVHTFPGGGVVIVERRIDGNVGQLGKDFPVCFVDKGIPFPQDVALPHLFGFHPQGGCTADCPPFDVALDPVHARRIIL